MAIVRFVVSRLSHYWNYPHRALICHILYFYYSITLTCLTRGSTLVYIAVGLSSHSLHPNTTFTRTTPHKQHNSIMRKNHAIILTLLLMVLFCVAFAYYLLKCCTRAVKAEVYNLAHQKDGGAQGSTGK